MLFDHIHSCNLITFTDQSQTYIYIQKRYAEGPEVLVQGTEVTIFHANLLSLASV